MHDEPFMKPGAHPVPCLKRGMVGGAMEGVKKKQNRMRISSKGGHERDSVSLFLVRKEAATAGAEPID